jgi:hypothetical protein
MNQRSVAELYGHAVLFNHTVCFCGRLDGDCLLYGDDRRNIYDGSPCSRRDNRSGPDILARVNKQGILEPVACDLPQRCRAYAGLKLLGDVGLTPGTFRMTET